MCREISLWKDVEFVHNSLSEVHHDIVVKGNFSPKVTAIVRLLIQLNLDARRPKCLVFSQWVSLLEVLNEACIENGVNSIMATTTSKFTANVTRFRSDPNTFVLLLPTNKFVT